jgi:hypothetical protein
MFVLVLPGCTVSDVGTTKQKMREENIEFSPPVGSACTFSFEKNVF